MDQWKQHGSGVRKTVRASTVGIELALSIGVGYLAGNALDDWLGTKPWLMIAMVILGSVAGFLNLFRSVKLLTKEDD